MIKIIQPTSSDESIFIWVQSGHEDVPDISIDIVNAHGRRYLSVRHGGMGIGGMLLDREIPVDHDGSHLQRFCSYCGEKIDLLSSKTHGCDA